MTEMTSVQVDYKHVEGWHVFCSESLPGLYVASTDAEEAYSDVPQAIEMLLRLNAGISCKATPELSFKEFMKARAQQKSAKSVRPAVLESQRYAVHACA